MTKGGMQIMMKNKFVLIRYVLMLWLLCGASYTLSIASAYDRTSPSASWGYQPLHSAAPSVNSSLYGNTLASTTTSGTYTPASSTSGTSSWPAIRFQSTSVLINSSDKFGQRIMDRGDNLMMSDPWGDDDPTGGGVGEIIQPVGEPLVLLFFALAFLGFRYYRRRNA